MESDWPRRKQKSLRHRNRFLAQVSRRYLSAERSDSRKYICIRRLWVNRLEEKTPDGVWQQVSEQLKRENCKKANCRTTVEPSYLKIGYLESPTILKSNYFPFNTLFSHLLSAIANSHYLKLSFLSLVG